MSVLPVSSESDTKPPLAKFGLSQYGMNVVEKGALGTPWTSTRRIGAACETAHISAPVWQPSAVGATWMVKLETERQKMSSAPLPFMPTAVTPPLMTTFRRVLAQAVDLGVIADRDVQRGALGSISTRLESSA